MKFNSFSICNEATLTDSIISEDDLRICEHFDLELKSFAIVSEDQPSNSFHCEENSKESDIADISLNFVTPQSKYESKDLLISQNISKEYKTSYSKNNKTSFNKKCKLLDKINCKNSSKESMNHHSELLQNKLNNKTNIMYSSSHQILESRIF